MNVDLSALPPSDGRGNYYFGKNKTLPAILVIQSPRNFDRGKYFVCPSGGRRPPMTADGLLKAFVTPEAALKVLRRLERGAD